MYSDIQRVLQALANYWIEEIIQKIDICFCFSIPIWFESAQPIHVDCELNTFFKFD